MTPLSPTEVAIVQNRYPDLFKAGRWQRAVPLVVAVVLAAYFAFVWSFFSISTVLERANWDIAGQYLADWISYESRPDIEFHDGYLTVDFPRFDPAGLDAHPDWLTTERADVLVSAPQASTVAATNGGAMSNTGFMGSLPVQGADRPDTGLMGSGGSVGAGPAAQAPLADAAPRVSDEVVRALVRTGAATLDIAPGEVEVTFRGQTLNIVAKAVGQVSAKGPLPDWAVQKAPGAKIVLYFGFAGRVEVEDDEVKIRNRFLGWENFLFDMDSPFWSRSATEVGGLIVSGPDLVAGTPNWALAFDNIWNNAEWQHGDVLVKLLQTIVMAFVGTLFAATLALPLSFLAARNITPSRLVNQVNKRLFDFFRSVDMLIWALFFTRAFGPGPLAGISAIFLTDTGTFGKLYSEALENVDEKQREGLRAVGAHPTLEQRFGVIPQVLPVFVSQALYLWESNTRSATIIGAVGAGGIGLKLWEAMRTNQDWENVAYMVLLILMVVFIFDAVSNALRSRLIRG